MIADPESDEGGRIVGEEAAIIARDAGSGGGDDDICIEEEAGPLGRSKRKCI